MEGDDLKCLLCGGEEETVYQLTKGCSINRVIWSQLPWALDIRSFQHQPIASWFTTIIDPSTLSGLPIEDHHKFQLYALITWDISWRTHNHVVHNEDTLNMFQLVAKIHRIFGEHVSAWHQKHVFSSNACWIPPLEGQFRANFDTAVREDFAIGAAIIKDHEGRIRGTVVRQIHVADPEEGEIWAAQLGLEEAQRCGLQLIEVEGDSLLVIEAFNNFPTFVIGDFMAE